MVILMGGPLEAVVVAVAEDVAVLLLLVVVLGVGEEDTKEESSVGVGGIAGVRGAR